MTRNMRIAGVVVLCLAMVGAYTVTGFQGIERAVSAVTMLAPNPPSPGLTFVDFSQCANDAAPSTSLACPGGWINGILNPNNSHYAEDTVVPQRFVLDVPNNAGGTHTLTFRYEARK